MRLAPAPVRQSGPKRRPRSASARSSARPASSAQVSTGWVATSSHQTCRSLQHLRHEHGPHAPERGEQRPQLVGLDQRGESSRYQAANSERLRPSARHRAGPRRAALAGSRARARPRSRARPRAGAAAAPRPAGEIRSSWIAGERVEVQRAARRRAARRSGARGRAAPSRCQQVRVVRADQPVVGVEQQAAPAGPRARGSASKGMQPVQSYSPAPARHRQAAVARPPDRHPSGADHADLAAAVGVGDVLLRRPNARNAADEARPSPAPGQPEAATRRCGPPRSSPVQASASTDGAGGRGRLRHQSEITGPCRVSRTRQRHRRAPLHPDRLGRGSRTAARPAGRQVAAGVAGSTAR